jgi:aryl-alcohol dehydrogenase-like predicted oxidoreductase
MNLGLGTVQFGLAYGISNKDGQTPESEVRRIVSLAAKKGMSVIDTASQYGESEKIVGLSLPDHHPFRFVTKTPSFQKKLLTESDALALKERFHVSLRDLKQESIYGLLIHNVGDLLSRNGALLWRTMQELKESGLVEKIGISIYSPGQLDTALYSFRPDLVQLPVNVLDQRMIQNGYLKRLKDLDIEIHSRSVFLQGLLLMDPITVPRYFSPIRRQLIRYHDLLHSNRIMPTEAALAFVRSVREIDVVVVGVNDSRQLQELCEIRYSAPSLQYFDFSSFSINDEAMVDPSRWN